jgi:hypothetical protein
VHNFHKKRYGMKGLQYALPASLSSLNTCTDSDNSKSTGETQQTRASPPENKRNRSRLQNSRNHDDADNSPDDGDDEENNENAPKHMPTADDSPLTVKRFACPFFQRDKALYAGWRGCPGPGWSNVARLKYVHLSMACKSPL